jgi:hypothetical protein
MGEAAILLGQRRDALADAVRLSRHPGEVSNTVPSISAPPLWVVPKRSPLASAIRPASSTSPSVQLAWAQKLYKRVGVLA